MGNRLYVGNLPFRADEDQVRELFGQNDRTVTEDKLITDRETPPKAGFFSRQGREYEAMFVLDDNNETIVKPRSADGIPELSDAAATPLDIGPCPFHPDKLVKRSPQGYRCELHASKE